MHSADQLLFPQSPSDFQMHLGDVDTSLMSRAKLKALVRKQVTPKKIVFRDKLAFVAGTVGAM